MSSQLSWRIINQFSSKNVLGFRFQDVVREFSGKHPAHLTKILADMVDKGMLRKIARDNYHIIPLNADPVTYFPDRHQVAKNIMQDKDYYIGYASALEIQGLIIQSASKESEARKTEIGKFEIGEFMTREYVVTKKQIKPAIRSLGGITYQFIYHSSTRFFGFDSIWINQLEKAMVSDLEKTIVDIATKPQLCGGIVEVGNAIYQAKDRTDQDKLFYYFARNMNLSAKKRFLFLTDLLDLEWTAEHNRMMEEIGSGISFLDPGVQDQGRRRSKFGLKINVDPNDIKKQVFQKW